MRIRIDETFSHPIDRLHRDLTVGQTNEPCHDAQRALDVRAGPGRHHYHALYHGHETINGITWLDDILCSAVSREAVKPAGQEAAAILRDRHHLRPEEVDDFNIRNPEDIIQAQLEASKTLTVLLIAIASISLIVGGIGIMNMMLVSVTERTREIGVRVPVGATEEAIQLQFLGESVMLSWVGGIDKC